MLINIFASLVYGINHISDGFKDRLWIYLYIKEDTKDTNETVDQIKKLTQEVIQAGMDIKYYSKTDALLVLQQKIPDVIKNFQKYGINNPLPATLYITFQNETDFEKLKTILINYRAIISNNADLEQTTINLRDQEKRVKSFIHMSQASIIGLIMWTIILLCIISTFLTFMVKSLFDSQLPYIQITKLLWATFHQIKIPFYISQTLILCTAFVLMSIIGFWLLRYIDPWMQDVYHISILHIVYQHYVSILWLLLLELIVLVGFNSIFSRFYLDHLLYKET